MAHYKTDDLEISATHTTLTITGNPPCASEVHVAPYVSTVGGIAAPALQKHYERSCRAFSYD